MVVKKFSSFANLPESVRRGDVARAGQEGVSSLQKEFEAGQTIFHNGQAFGLGKTPPPVPPPITPPPVVDPSLNTPGGQTDFTSRFEDFKKSQGTPFDFDTAKAKLESAEENRRGVMRSVISRQAAGERLRAERLGKEREGGLAAGLGMTQGLNFSTLGTDELKKITDNTTNELERINQAERDAISKSSITNFKEFQASLNDLRTQKATHEANLISAFDSIVTREQNQQAQDRLDKGQASTTANQKRDDARTVLNKLLLNFTGSDLSSLPQEVQDAMTKIELEAGYPTGFVAQGLATLKELKQGQDKEIADAKLDEQEAAREQNNFIKALLGTPRGVTVNIPGLGDVTGVKPPTSSGSSVTPSQSIQTEEQILNNAGDVMGFRRTFKDGTTKITDALGQPMSIALIPGQYTLRKVRTEESSNTGVDALRNAFGLGGSLLTTPIK